MKLGYLGLGKMGKNMVLRLLENGHQIVAWNRSPGPREEVAAAGAETVATVEAVVLALSAPRTVWLMLPAGDVTGEMITALAELLQPGDTIIDGANSFFGDTVARSTTLTEKGIRFIDAGVSGGPNGARNGACVMIGGETTVFNELEPLFRSISAPGAYQHFPGIGAGHFVKMVHNGIEYGMMQAIGEGFEVLKKADFNLDVAKVAKIYNAGSVIESRLVGWLESGYKKNGVELTQISGSVKHSGEGQWTVETAKKMGIPVPVIAASLQFRIDSAANPSYTGKVVSTLRNEFGGHQVAVDSQVTLDPKP